MVLRMELKVRSWERKCAAIWMVLESESFPLHSMEIPSSLPWERWAGRLGWFGHSDKANIDVTGQSLYQHVFRFISLICTPLTDPADSVNRNGEPSLCKHRGEEGAAAKASLVREPN